MQTSVGLWSGGTRETVAAPRHVWCLSDPSHFLCMMGPRTGAESLAPGLSAVPEPGSQRKAHLDSLGASVESLIPEEEAAGWHVLSWKPDSQGFIDGNGRLWPRAGMMQSLFLDDNSHTEGCEVRNVPCL